MAPALVNIYDVLYEFPNKEPQHQWMILTSPDVLTVASTFTTLSGSAVPQAAKFAHPSGAPKIISIKNVGTALTL